MDELKEAEREFLAALGSRSDLPGINDVNLATAAVALLRAERVAPGSDEVLRMRAAFSRTGRQDVYEAVRAAVRTQP